MPSECQWGLELMPLKAGMALAGAQVLPLRLHYSSQNLLIGPLEILKRSGDSPE